MEPIITKPEEATAMQRLIKQVPVATDISATEDLLEAVFSVVHAYLCEQS
jgi:hypothetical protein